MKKNNHLMKRNLNGKRRPSIQRDSKSCRRRGWSILFVCMLLLPSFPFSPNVSQAATQNSDLLDIAFGGAFSSDAGYTNSTGELMDGNVTRRTGMEDISNGSVQLNGGRDGVDFNPRVDIGTDTVDMPLIVETVFNPEQEAKNLNTLLSVGGNMYVRYTDSQTIEYGFEVNNNGHWSSVKETIPAPKAGEDHSLALFYEPTSKGATMQVFLDGRALPAVTSENGGAPMANVDNAIGFGNEVHKGGLNRGFKGTISRAVVTSYEGDFDPSLLKTMNLSQVNRSLLVFGTGSLDESIYTASEDEVTKGDVKIIDGEITGTGRINLNGENSQIVFETTDPLAKDGVLEGNYIAEILAESSAVEPGVTLIDLAGALTIRRSMEGEAIDILVEGQQKQSIDISGKLNKDHLHLSLIYTKNKENEYVVTVMLGDQQLGDKLILTEELSVNRDSVIFAGDGADADGKRLTGEVYGVAFSSLEGKFGNDFLGLLGGPCTVPADLEPSNRIEINANECSYALAEKASLVRPKPKQVKWQQYEQTAFIHYGINTYYGVEWGGFNLDPNMFQPTDLDTDQWARTLKESGFKMAVITVKHHDGFTLYPSRYTDFGVGSSSWKNGNGDVLREFVDSMRKYGLKVGVYLSPADHQAYSDGIFANGSERQTRNIPTLVEGDDRIGDTTLPTFELAATDYGEMLLNQLYEVLTEYGQIDEVWFDGAQGNIPGNAVENYDWDSYYELINSLQPEAVVAVTGHDVRWVGNESGFARENEWSVLGAGIGENGRQYYYPSFKSPDLGSRKALTEAAANGMDYLTWWPAEVDVSIRPGWFYHDNQQPKSVDQLRNIYYNSVARNSVLLLNIPPNKDGKFAEQDVERLKEWHKSIKRDFAINHAEEAVITAENGDEDTDPTNVTDSDYDTDWKSATKDAGSMIFTFDKEVEVDRIVLQENIHHGQQVESFAIEAFIDGEWKKIHENNAIGYKRIVSLPETVSSTKYRVQILKSRGVYHFSEIGLYQTLPEGKAMVDLEGQDSVVAGDTLELDYSLSELPEKMTEGGVTSHELTINYNKDLFSFDSVESLLPESLRVVETQENNPGELQITAVSEGEGVGTEQPILKFKWKSRIHAVETNTSFTISDAKLKDQEGIEAEAVKATHYVQLKPTEIEINPGYIIKKLDEYLANGDIKKSLYKQLSNRLKQAEHHKAREQNKQAIKKLQDFQKHLNKASDASITDNVRLQLDDYVQFLEDLWAK
ncbi:alpha-L-fucosidase [Virgibacillus halodenitrificans]|uniref:alpha-L-fucosidase n=1 Tax=Virgibacillus halodenitrificans TaxID=1482 RepID=UPI0024BFDA20|nr:alpha-L-fucosidase [Virgibacillus halodenitrificans]WHX26109.1 alpha-L-fucosidase [Virgibacillus halodenitrificans]